MSSTPQNTRALVAYGVTMALAGLVTLYGLFLLRQVLMLFYVAGLLAIGISPLVRWLERRSTERRIPRWVAILFVYLGLLLVNRSPLLHALSSDNPVT